MTVMNRIPQSTMLLRLVVVWLMVSSVVGVEEGGLWFHEVSFGGQIFSFPPSYWDGRSDTDSGMFYAIYSRPEGAPPLQLQFMPQRGCGLYQEGQLSAPIEVPRTDNAMIWNAEAGYRCWTERGLQREMDTENARRINDNWQRRVEYLEQLVGIEDPMAPELVEMPYSVTSSKKDPSPPTG